MSRWTGPALDGADQGCGAVALRGELAVAVLPRRTAFTRVVAGRSSAEQVVAENLEVVLVVDALTTAPRLHRVERYLAVARAAVRRRSSSSPRPTCATTSPRRCWRWPRTPWASTSCRSAR
ncbi:hypothetical protein [Geodermatophilus sp. DF01-2]|uniref:hypothetical protein n=1 Tax=Geodermatophilus sp. DF01-2 TaxID=2559610 RepID=UPI001FD7861E|nr:hypothetical protein [Geodermatophilus sp. DF01_2]